MCCDSEHALSREEIDLNIELLSQDSNGIIELVKEDLMVPYVRFPLSF
jgi:hypothetical protein